MKKSFKQYLTEAEDDSYKFEGRITSLETQLEKIEEQIMILYKQIQKNQVINDAEVKAQEKQVEELLKYIQSNHLRINKLEGK